MRVGHGYDVHRFKAGRRCVLCGVEIPSDFGPDGHSDADVPVHALMDGILGALALGDIGQHFPDTDERWKDADSMMLLGHVCRLMDAKGYCLSNADITIITQKPRLAEYVEKMRQSLAEAFKCTMEDINVKATTEEGMGFTGSGDGIAAHAVVLICKK